MAKNQEITKNVTFGELISNYPKAAKILTEHGLYCFRCPLARYETIEQGAKAHGLTQEEISTLLFELNKQS